MFRATIYASPVNFTPPLEMMKVTFKRSVCPLSHLNLVNIFRFLSLIEMLTLFVYLSAWSVYLNFKFVSYSEFTCFICLGPCNYTNIVRFFFLYMGSQYTIKSTLFTLANCLIEYCRYTGPNCLNIVEICGPSVGTVWGYVAQLCG